MGRLTASSTIALVVTAIAALLASVNQRVLADDIRSDLNFSGQHLQSRDFSGADLRRASFAGATIRDVSFIGANLRDVDFHGANFSSDTTSSSTGASVIAPSANFRGADVAGANFRDADLSGARFVGVKGLPAAHLDGARLHDLNGVDLPGADLRKAHLENSELYRANLAGANLSGVNLDHAILVHANLSNANLQGCDLTRADLRMADLHGANLTGATLSNTEAAAANLTGCIGLAGDDLSGLIASLDTRFPDGVDAGSIPKLSNPNPDGIFDSRDPVPHSDLRPLPLAGKSFINREMHFSLLGPDLTGADFRQADLEHVIADQSTFANAHLGGARFDHACLSRSKFAQAIEAGQAQFSNAKLDGARFARVDLLNADFVASYAPGADFAGSKLTFSSFRDADVAGANFTGCDLTGVHFDGADVSGAIFDGARLDAADLRRALGLTRAQLASAASSAGASLPQSLGPHAPPRTIDGRYAVAPAIARGEHAAPAPVDDGSVNEDDQPVRFFSPGLRNALLNAALVSAVPLAMLFFVPILLKIGQWTAGSAQASAVSPMAQRAGAMPPMHPSPRPLATAPSPASSHSFSPALSMPETSDGRSSVSAGKIVAIAVAVILMLVGALIFYFTYIPDYEYAIARKDWVRTPCSIDFFDRGDEATYEYRFPTANDKTYHGTLLMPALMQWLSETPDLRGQFRQGVINQHCYVNPVKPDESVLRRGMVFAGGSIYPAIGLFEIGAIMLVLTFVSGGRSAAAARDPLSGGSASLVQGVRRDRRTEQLTGLPTPPSIAGPVTFRSMDVRLSRYNAATITMGVIYAIAGMAGMISYLSRGRAGIYIAAGIAALGLFSVAAVRKRFRQLQNPSLEVTFARAIETGRPNELSWTMTGNPKLVTNLVVSFEGTELATYTVGTDTKTDKRVFQRIDILLTRMVMPDQAGGRMLGHQALLLPPNTMHTFCAKHNEIRWVLHVTGEVAGANIDDSIPVTLYPHGVIP